MKDVNTARANLEASIVLIPDRYRRGVQQADWQTNAGSDQAEQNWMAGVQQAGAAKRRQAAIRAVGNQAWQQASATKGADAIAQGIRNGLNKYAANFGKVYAAAQPAFAALPPKTADPMQNIQNRLIPSVMAWRRAAGKAN